MKDKSLKNIRFVKLFGHLFLCLAVLLLYACDDDEEWDFRKTEYTFSYTVSFNSNGGSEVDEQLIIPSEKVTEPPQPKKLQHRFNGWFEDPALTKRFDFDKVRVAKNFVLYAAWTREYVVKFELNGGNASHNVAGSEIKEQVVGENEKALKVLDPSKADLAFAGWYRDKDLKQPFDFSHNKIVSDTILYAAWTKDFYTISFDNAGGKEIPLQRIGTGRRSQHPSKSIFKLPIDTSKYPPNTWRADWPSAGGLDIDLGRFPKVVEWKNAEGEKVEVNYRFDGWYTKPDANPEDNNEKRPKDASKYGERFDFENAEIAEHIRIYAHWTPLFPVEFDDGVNPKDDADAVWDPIYGFREGQDLPKKRIIVSGDTIVDKNHSNLPIPQIPTRERATFKNWVQTENGSATAFNFKVAVTKPMTVFADWTPHYRVIFDDGVNAAANTEVDDPITRRAGDGIGFIAGQGEVLDILPDFILNTPQSGESKISSKGEQVIVSGSRAVKPDSLTSPLADPTRTHFTFMNWVTTENGTTPFDFSNPITGHTTIYARWQRNVYTVKFNIGKGDPDFDHNAWDNAWSADSNKNSNIEVNIDPAEKYQIQVKSGLTLEDRQPKKNPYSSKYRFLSWHKTSALKDADRMAQNPCPAPSPAPPTPAVCTQPKPQLNDPDKTVAAGANRTPVITSDTTIYAKWDATYYTLHFDTHGGSPVAEQQRLPGDTGKEPAANLDMYPVLPDNLSTMPRVPTTKAGYRFDGWFSKDPADATFNEVSDRFHFSIPITGPITAHARWMPQYKIEFDTDGGSAILHQWWDSNKNSREPTTQPTKANHRFDGWVTAGGAPITSGGTTLFDFGTTSGTTLLILTAYARWIPIYTVNFNTNTGITGSGVTTTSISSQRIERDITTLKPALRTLPVRVRRPTNPTKQVNDGIYGTLSYRFDGWFTDTTFTTSFNFSTAINADTSIYAKWTPRYKVNFNTHGGSSIAGQELYENESTPDDPVKTHSNYNGTFDGWFAPGESLPEQYQIKSGYRFDDWYTDSAYTTQFDFTASLTGNTTAHAKYVEQHIVSFKVNGGQLPSGNNSRGKAKTNFIIDDGDTMTKPTPTWTDRTFLGWYTDRHLTRSFSFSTRITADRTLYAKWKPNKLFNPHFIQECNGKLYVQDENAIVQLNNSGGLQPYVSRSGTVGDGTGLSNPSRYRGGMTCHGGSLYVSKVKGIIQVNLSNGDRTVITGNGKGTGPLVNYQQAAYYNGYLFAPDYTTENLYKIDPASGNRELFVNGAYRYSPNSVVYGGFIYTVEMLERRLIKVDASGTRSYTNIGLNAIWLLHYSGTNYLIKANSTSLGGGTKGIAIYTISFSNVTTLLSGEGRGTGQTFTDIRSIAGLNGSLYVVDITQDNVFKVDPTSGARTIFAR